MTVYLVDFENVRSEGLKGVEELSKTDKVVIFYSKNADAITFDVHLLLSKSSAEIETYMILRGGHNSLDFQLSTYLGYLVMENCYNKIVIISKDKGFLCVTNFWEENSDKCNSKIMLCRSIKSAASDVELDGEFDDGLSGKFIERLNGKAGILGVEDDKEDEIEDFEDVVNKSNEPLSQDNPTENSSKIDVKGNTSLDNGKKSYNSTNTNGRNYSRPPGPKRTTYCTNIFTKSEPYYRKPYQGPYENKRPVTTKVEGDKSNLIPNKPYVHNVKETVEEKIGFKKDMGDSVLPPNPQNPTSQKKIFAAEVKFNIKDDVTEIIKGKFDEALVPLLVETIGLSTGKQHFYRMMVSRIGQKDGLEVYKLIKGQYANLKRK